MPFAHKVVHVSLIGTMLGGQEEWTTGFYVGKDTADANAPTQSFVDGVRDAWITYFTAANSGIASQYTFTAAKATLLATDGKKDTATDVQNSYPTGIISGGSAGLPLPPQVSLVATLVAGSGKGIGGKGRMYLPGVKYTLDDGGHISDANCLATANNLKTFFNAVNGLIGGNYLINASKGSAKIAGINAKNIRVNGIRVGNVYDTQRRRRNSLAETYQAAVVPAV